MRHMRKTLIVSLLLLAACRKSAAPVALVYQAIPVERRDIVVSASANGTIQPDTIVDVRSQASGEVLEVKVETGQVVKPGQLLVVIDPRIPKNNVDQAKANTRSAEINLGYTQVTAPFDGVVTARNVDVGSLVKADSNDGPALFAVADLHQVAHEIAGLVVAYPVPAGGLIRAGCQILNRERFRFAL